MGASPRVMYVALDACDVDVVRELAAAGDLPTFARLFEQAAVARVEPPPGVFVSANWPSFTTALQPDRHNYLCWVEAEPGGYGWRETVPEICDGRPFWDVVSEVGRRVCVVDVPHTLPSPTINGAQVVEWGCHDRHYAPASSPPELLDELESHAGRHPIGTLPPARDKNFAPCDFVHRSGDQRNGVEVVALWRDLLAGIDCKERLSLELLDREPWDLFVSVIGESHCTGHQLWHVHDPCHPQHDPAAVALIGDPIREMYRRLDATVDRHLERAGTGTVAYVHLSHGMGPHHDGTHLLDTILKRLDAGTTARGRKSEVLGEVVSRLPVRWQTEMTGRLAPRIRRRIAQMPPRDDIDPPVPHADRRWFEVPNNTVFGGVRINLVGRERHGKVRAADYDRACGEIERGLRELVNVDTGEPIVRAVIRSDAVYRRRRDDAMPDLFIDWNHDAPISRVYSPRIGTVVGEYRDWRTGDHIPHGALFATGPGIAPGERRDALRMCDVGAILSAAVGVALDDVDGRPARDLLPDAGSPTVRTVPGADRRTTALRSRRAEGAAPASRRTVDRLAAEHRATRELAEDVSGREDELRRRVVAHGGALELFDGRLERLERLATIDAVTDWVRHADVPEGPLVSVIMPTRNRGSVLAGAVDSVLSQSYPHWELVVTNDGSTDDTPERLAAYDSTRIVVVDAEGVGASAARNRALKAATGDLVVYLDDDNQLTPDWLKAVVWAFSQRPEVDVAYGARIIDDVLRATAEGTGAMPWVQFEPFDHERLTRHNFADVGVLAHRAGLPEAWFDEELVWYGDWDLFWRLTRAKPPLELPVIALHYSTEAAGRLSYHGDNPEEREVVRRKFARILRSV